MSNNNWSEIKKNMSSIPGLQGPKGNVSFLAMLEELNGPAKKQEENKTVPSMLQNHFDSTASKKNICGNAVRAYAEMTGQVVASEGKDIVTEDAKEVKVDKKENSKKQYAGLSVVKELVESLDTENATEIFEKVNKIVNQIERDCNE